MSEPRVITVADLKDQLGSDSPRLVLRCAKCGEQYSAHRGDYFFSRSPTHTFYCCGEPMRLVIKKVIYEEVEP